MDSNQIGVEGASEIAKVLNDKTSLTILWLSSNQIGDEGASEIAKALKHNTSLIILRLDSNQIGDEGASKIAKALKHNTSLSQLYLVFNEIRDEGASEIAKALKHNTLLTILSLIYNQIRVEGASEIAKALKHNTSLKIYQSNHHKYKALSYNGIRDERVSENRQIDKPSTENDEENIISNSLQHTTEEKNMNCETAVLDTSENPQISSPQFHEFDDLEIIDTSLEKAKEMDLKEFDEFNKSRNCSRRDSDFDRVGLSIDGGGMRGLIPALLLYQLEQVTSKKIMHLFDYIGGTSIGGVLTLGYAASEDGRQPLYSGETFLNLFKKDGNQIFPRAGYLRGTVKNIFWSSRYSIETLDTLLNKYFKKLNLSDTGTDVLVTTVEILTKDKLDDQIRCFESLAAQKNECLDFLMKDVARATSAAPTYFKAHRCWDVGKSKERVFIDGGVRANNPSHLVLDRLNQLYEDENSIVKIVSLGTGREKEVSSSLFSMTDDMSLWRAAPAVLNTALTQVSEEAHYEVKSLLGDERYWRLQPELEYSVDLADTRMESLELLEEATKPFQRQIEQIGRVLCENLDRKKPGSLQV